MNVRFWGVRGSYPVPGPGTVRYGGNTSCVEVRIGAPGDAAAPRIIIDAGTGLRRLGKDMMQEEFGKGEGEGHLLVSHTHWDHIQGLPFFAPMYQAGNKFHVYARQRNDTHLRAIFASQSDTPYFSVPFDAAAADVDFTELTDNAHFQIGPVKVRCTRLNHPWIAIAYRLDYDGASVAYVTDTAPFRDILIEQQYIRQPPKPGDPLRKEDAVKLAAMREGVVRLCEGADLVIYDTQFTPAEYAAKPHWGHSCPEDALEIVREAGASALALFHHAPERTDDQIDDLLRYHREQVAQHHMPIALYAAFEGMELPVSPLLKDPAFVAPQPPGSLPGTSAGTSASMPPGTSASMPPGGESR